MPSIKEVKNRIGSVQSTQQLTKAMKMVAAAKLKRAQDKVLQLRPYSKKLNEVLSNLSDTTIPFKTLLGMLFFAFHFRGYCSFYSRNLLSHLRNSCSFFKLA